MPKISLDEWFETVGLVTTPLGLASRAMTISAFIWPGLPSSTPVDFPSIEHTITSLVILIVGAYLIPWLAYSFTLSDPRLSTPRLGRFCLAPSIGIVILGFAGFAVSGSSVFLMVAALVQALYAIVLFAYFHVTNPARKPSNATLD
jgi:hypothetical protein